MPNPSSQTESSSDDGYASAASTVVPSDFFPPLRCRPTLLPISDIEHDILLAHTIKEYAAYVPSKAAAESKSVYVASIDLDGCVFNTYYKQKRIQGRQHPEDQILESNKLLFAYLDATNKADKSVLLCGSNRQSEQTDRDNALRNNTDLGTFAMKILFANLHEKGWVHDEYLLAMLYGDEASFIFDESKISLLYTQIHKVASEHKEHAVLFNFFDDRRDILYRVTDFFEQNPHMCPHNVTMHVHCYNGLELELIKSVPGAGIINPNYADTVKAMASAIRKPLALSFFRKRGDFASYSVLMGQVIAYKDTKKEVDALDALCDAGVPYESLEILEEGLYQLIISNYQHVVTQIRSGTSLSSLIEDPVRLTPSERVSEKADCAPNALRANSLFEYTHSVEVDKGGPPFAPCLL